jgi:hypothetical protein
MTHEELQAHNGTVWSFAGYSGIREYEYLGFCDNSLIGRFRRVEDGEITHLYLNFLYPTKRDGLECHLKMCENSIMYAHQSLQEAQEWIKALNVEESSHE